MSGMTLVDFLRARLDEDEAVAKAAVREEYRHWEGSGPDRYDEGRVYANGEVIVWDEGTPSGECALHIARHDPARVLADVQAKREIISWVTLYVRNLPPGVRADGIIRRLAVVYADHPDYQPEWTP